MGRIGHWLPWRDAGAFEHSLSITPSWTSFGYGAFTSVVGGVVTGGPDDLLVSYVVH